MISSIKKHQSRMIQVISTYQGFKIMSSLLMHNPTTIISNKSSAKAPPWAYGDVESTYYHKT